MSALVEVNQEYVILKIKSASPGEDLSEIQKALLQAVESVHDVELRAVLVQLLEASLLDSSQIDSAIQGNSM